MGNDLILGLTRAVKEEVIENYLLNRRIIDEICQDFEHRKNRVNRYRELVGKRFLRIFGLLIDPHYIKEFIKIIEVERIRPFEFFGSDLDMRQLRLIPASGFTFRSRYRTLLREAYNRLVKWVTRYNESYAELFEECKAVNINIKNFNQEFDLLAIIHFLKTMDIADLERKQFLGGNFTSKELHSLEKKMLFHPINWESLRLPKPIDLPEYRRIRKPLQSLSDRVFDGYQAKLRSLIK
ncbi:MAG: hypothetical protein HY788_11460 [Deltaproteobacteria bacterium]|nr:hypothetical protein [Deltaproteobacteria bacterium]